VEVGLLLRVGGVDTDSECSPRLKNLEIAIELFIPEALIYFPATTSTQLLRLWEIFLMNSCRNINASFFSYSAWKFWEAGLLVKRCYTTSMFPGHRPEFQNYREL
jgi:hypothetical protein